MSNVHTASGRVLVCRIAWMDFYEGVTSDLPKGGGSFVEEHGFGHEVFNFQRGSDGIYRGYVRPPSGGQEVKKQRMNLERLGAATGTESVEGVTVVWCAPRPKDRGGGMFVVGWYDDAVVHRQWLPSPIRRELPNGDDAGYMMESRMAHLVPSDDRMFVVPRAQTDGVGMGQANIWYASDADGQEGAPEWVARFFRYREQLLAGAAVPPADVPPLPPARMTDTEERQRIEMAAMRATEAWCRERGLACRDVSGKKVGWDLEAGVGTAILRIEVKGTSRELGSAVVELTPNEYARLNEHRSSFRISIVAVDAEPLALGMFAWSDERQRWMSSARELELNVVEVLGARAAVGAPTLDAVKSA